MKRADFEAKVQDVKKRVLELPAVSEDLIDATAKRLLGLNYAPSTILDLEKFLKCSATDLVTEIDVLIDREVKEKGDSDDVFEHLREYISVLHFYFVQVTDLRLDVPEAWDEVDELYVHD